MTMVTDIWFLILSECAKNIRDLANARLACRLFYEIANTPHIYGNENLFRRIHTTNEYSTFVSRIIYLSAIKRIRCYKMSRQFASCRPVENHTMLQVSKRTHEINVCSNTGQHLGKNGTFARFVILPDFVHPNSNVVDVIGEAFQNGEINQDTIYLTSFTSYMDVDLPLRRWDFVIFGDASLICIRRGKNDWGPTYTGMDKTNDFVQLKTERIQDLDWIYTRMGYDFISLPPHLRNLIPESAPATPSMFTLRESLNWAISDVASKNRIDPEHYALLSRFIYTFFSTALNAS